MEGRGSSSGLRSGNRSWSLSTCSWSRCRSSGDRSPASKQIVDGISRHLAWKHAALFGDSNADTVLLKIKVQDFFLFPSHLDDVLDHRKRLETFGFNRVMLIRFRRDCLDFPGELVLKNCYNAAIRRVLSQTYFDVLTWWDKTRKLNSSSESCLSKNMFSMCEHVSLLNLMRQKRQRFIKRYFKNYYKFKFEPVILVGLTYDGF